MPHVVVSTSLCRQFTGAETSFEVAALDIRGVLRELNARFPGFEAFIDTQMAIAIDGEIFQNVWTQPLRPDSEIYLIPRIGAG